MVHLLGYIRYNKTLGLKYYADMKDVHLSELLRQDSINIENQFMAFYDSSWKDCLDTGRSKVEYIIFYQDGPIDHGTHVQPCKYGLRRQCLFWNRNVFVLSTLLWLS